MGRNRASAPTVRHTSAPAPAPAPARAAPAPAHTHQSTAQPHAQPQQQPHHNSNTQPQVTNIYVQRGGMGGGGGGSGMLGTMAAVAGGSVIGHGISNYLYGSGHQAPPTQPAEAQELAAAAQQQQHACAPQLTGYAKCLEANQSSADQCAWAWDYFQQCQQQNPQQQQ